MYDIIVIGNDISSWVAACMALSHGKNVVLLSDGDSPDFFYESGYAFPIDTFPMVGLGVSQACRNLLEIIDRELVDSLSVRLLNPALQIIHKEHRIDIPGDKKQLLREITREFPRQGAAIKQFYDWLEKNRGLVLSGNSAKTSFDLKIFKDYPPFININPAMIQGRLNWFKIALAIRKVPVLKMLFESQLTAFSYQFGNSGGLYSLLHNLSSPMEGVYVQEGDKNSFRDRLRKKYLDAGGKLIVDCSIAKIAVGKEMEVMIFADGKQVKISGRHLIVSTKWEKLKRLILNNKAFRRLNERYSKIKAFHYPLTLHMGVYSRMLPEKMGAFVVLLGDKEDPLCSDGCVFLECSLPGDSARAPDGQRALTATVFLNESPLRLTDAELKGTIEYIWKSMEEFLPFIRENLNFIDVEKSIAFSRKRQETVNGRVEFHKSLFSGSRMSVKTSVKNVFITGGMLLPHLGLEGEILSGMRAASLAIR